jgi:RNA polymerase sigma factor (sigma-70 family)
MHGSTVSSNDNDDALLITAVLRKDVNAFRKLVIQYERLVISIVFKMIDQKEDCEDICQDVFLKVYENLPSFRFQSRLSTWIGNIAFNTCVNFLQKRKHILLEDLAKPVYPDDDGCQTKIKLSIEDAGNAPDKILLQKEQGALLSAGIEQLSIIQKTVLQLFHQNGLSLQEVSEVTGLPVSTVKSHLFRARKYLKEIIKYNWYGN